MRYLVTGGAGFIGSHIVDRLLSEGYEVVILDSLIKEPVRAIPQEVRLIKKDIRDVSATDFAGIDGVFHCAALTSVQESIENPEAYHDVNVNGTLKVLIAASEAKVKRLVYSASAAAYGDTIDVPSTEQARPQPQSPYGLQKYIGEHYARVFSQITDLETVSLRYFNVFGPRMGLRGGYINAISVFMKQWRQQQPLTVTGDGTQTRDFIYVGDIARANVMAMTSDTVGSGEVLNIGSGVSRTINSVAELISQNITYIAPRLEPHDSQADITLAKTLISWEPQTDFNQALEETKSWIQTLEVLP
ncbi:MAG: NAD-dependent epimerase/dehydratase family protein [Candidatus Buchananbacteria bacterium]|nr:NAD-dependent epimerase/dehydratase family protein [Candidatus Buchananbacteria bacterium]